MTKSVEQGPLPSILDMLLDVYRKSPEGHILITTSQARDTLLDILYQEYKDSVKTPDSKIDALREVCRKSVGEHDVVDFTEIVEKIEASRMAEGEENLRRSIGLGVFGTVRPKRPII